MQFRHPNFDILVSPRHRFYCRSKASAPKHCSLPPTSEAFKDNRHLKTAHERDLITHDVRDFPGIPN